MTGRATGGTGPVELAPDDDRLGLRGHAELVRCEGFVTPWRLPVNGERWLVDPVLADRASMPAGVRLDFRTDASALEWRVDVASPAGSDRVPAPFDIVVDGRLLARTQVRGEGVVAARLPPGTKRVVIWLPQYGLVRLGPLRLAGAGFAEATDTAPHVVLYGSSITQCNGAPGPSRTWPALVAAAHDWNLRCLGLAGQCHLDPSIARYIRAVPADLISMCVGVNIHGKSSFSRRSFAAALAGFVDTVREGHPDTPLVLMTPIATADREQAPNDTGMTLAEVRAEVERVHAFVRGRGDAALHLIDGLGVLSPGETGLLADGLHPTGDGYRLMADRLTPLLGAHLPGSPACGRADLTG